MKLTDMSEKGLETLIVNSLIQEAGYQRGEPKDYNCEYSVDVVKLMNFLQATQPKITTMLGIEEEGYARKEFLHRLQSEITKRGIADCLRNGIRHNAAPKIDLFYLTPSPSNTKAQENYTKNIFSVTRQLHYSVRDSRCSVDIVIFINGLPIATLELKNKLTNQAVNDAIKQYKFDRNPQELLFQFGRCIVHFAVDDHQVQMCTHLQGESSYFLPFNKGHNDGAGNPPNPDGLATDYLWKDIFTKTSITDIIENYIQMIEQKDEKTGQIKHKQIFPRYHQLDVVRKLLKSVQQVNIGKRYLIQHSAGSGKSNSIVWLACQLIGASQNNRTLFDSIIILTDRQVLDKQINNTINKSELVSGIVGHAENANDLKALIEKGKKIIITTIQKFIFVSELEQIEDRNRRFAVIIDEAHSSQGGKATAAMNKTLYNDKEMLENGKTAEDQINTLVESEKMNINANYFAFTATPKNKTLEVFGESMSQVDGKVKYLPFHSYTMQQAIEEEFILDVLKNYICSKKYFQLAKSIEDDPRLDVKQTQRKLRNYIEFHKIAISKKTEIMINHFYNQVIKSKKMNGQARAMIVTRGIKSAIQYFYTFKKYLEKCSINYQPIIAFSGEYEYKGERVTEASLNGFASSQILSKMKQDPYRFLIVADKYQTGYDEPLLHTMYVDKKLSGIKAVQTLSRINRAYSQKNDTCILDFRNKAETIQKAFMPFYRTTILSEGTNINQLYDLQSDLEKYQVYSASQIDEFISCYVNNVERSKIDVILDHCANDFAHELTQDQQIEFKHKAQKFIEIYNLIATTLPFTNLTWKKLSLFLNFLIFKLPLLEIQDVTKHVHQLVALNEYQIKINASISIEIFNETNKIQPISGNKISYSTKPELDRLTSILEDMNDQDITQFIGDEITQKVLNEIISKVSANATYQNAVQNNDEKTAKLEHDKVLENVILELSNDYSQLFKLFSDNSQFKNRLKDKIFEITYQEIMGIKKY